MDPIKEAFFKVKEEINSLKEQISFLNERVSILESLLNSQHKDNEITADIHDTAVKTAHSLEFPQEIKGLKKENFTFSTRNIGVTADKPTDRQTNQQTDITYKNTPAEMVFSYFIPEKKQLNITKDSSIDELEKAQNLLDNLDSIKKEIRLKFKSLTNREMLLFTTIYSLEEQGVEEITYHLLSKHLNLTESSIRDYTNKLFSKNMPLIKIKLNNKQVTLKIPDSFKKIVSLQTLLKLREI